MRAGGPACGKTELRSEPSGTKNLQPLQLRLQHSSRRSLLPTQVPLGREKKLGQVWSFPASLVWLQDTTHLRNQLHAGPQMGVARGTGALLRLWAFDCGPPIHGY